MWMSEWVNECANNRWEPDSEYQIVSVVSLRLRSGSDPESDLPNNRVALDLNDLRHRSRATSVLNWS